MMVNGIGLFIFSFLLLEIVLWFFLADKVTDRGLLALLLFFFGNLVLTATVSCYLLMCKRYGRDIESLVPGLNRYHHLFYSFQDEVLLDHILRQLLKGKYAPTDYEAYFEKNPLLDFGNEYRIVVFVPEHEHDHLMAAYKICSLAFLDIGKEDMNIYMLEVDNLLLGLCFSGNGRGFDRDTSWLRMSHCMNYAQVKVEEKLDVHLYAASSGRHLGLAALKTGFSEALEAYEYQRIYDDENSQIFYNNIRFEDFEGDKAADDVWYELERKFLRYFSIEDFENSAAILERIVALAGSGRPQDFQMTKYKVFGLINSLYIHILERKGIAEELLNINAIYHISNCRSVAELQSKVRIIYKALEQKVSGGEEAAGASQRVQGIIKYLHGHYKNPDLNIVCVADAFRLSPAYLSRLFKKEIGVGPAEYLQRIRVEAAKEYLAQSDLTVKDISEAVGYQYVLTFNRAFKKLEGITPSQFIVEQKANMSRGER